MNTTTTTTKPFASQAQARACFARQGRGEAGSWNCRKWAHETPGGIKKLPKRAKRKAWRAATKGEKLGPGVTRIHGDLCNVHGKYGSCSEAGFGAPASAADIVARNRALNQQAAAGGGKGGKGRAARKPVGGKGGAAAKPKKTEEQKLAEAEAKKREREAEREAKRQADATAKRVERDRILTEQGLGKNLQGALIDARDGNVIAPVNGAELTKRGLAEQAADGSYRLTTQGRQAIDAAERNDAGRVADALSAGRDAVAKQGQRDAERTQRAAEREGEKKKREAERATAQKKRAQERKQRAREQAQARAKRETERQQLQAKRETERATREQERRNVAAQRAAERGAQQQQRAATAAAKPAQQREERNRILAANGIDQNLTGALVDAREGNLITPANGAKLTDLGLTAQAADGSYRLTASGRQVVDAASRGDAGQVADKLSEAKDMAARARARAQAKKEIRAMGDIFSAMRAWLTGEKASEPVQETEKATWDTAFVNNLPDSAFLFIESGGTKDSEGKTVPRSLRHFPYKDADGAFDLPHLRNAIARIPQSNAPGLNKEAVQKRAQALLEKANKDISVFTTFKDAEGRDRWLSITTTAYRDKDREIISSDAIRGAVALGDSSGQRGPLRFWHVPGLDLGDCDYQATMQDGRFLVESGTFRKPSYAVLTTKAAAEGYQMSPGFVHPASEPDADGVFHNIALFERSIVPPGRASNPFTRLMVKENRVLTEEKEATLKALVGDDTLLAELLGQVKQSDKAAQDAKVAYKDAPDWAQALISRLDALEATMKQDAMPPEEMPPLELPPEELPPGGDESGLTLSPDDLTAITQAVAAALSETLAPLVGAVNVEGKMRGMMDEMKGMFGSYAAKKDDEAAQVKEQLAGALAQLKELEGDLPVAASWRPSQSPDTIVTDPALLASLAGPPDDPFADIRKNLFGH